MKGTFEIVKNISTVVSFKGRVKAGNVLNATRTTILIDSIVLNAEMENPQAQVTGKGSLKTGEVFNTITFRLQR